ncbi:hypothetical protein [Streptomyces sp. ERV7]|uniref:hypothetical protein n=1 Tax=Streptomyces sp. ERV7 TaxID=1322334 RepID=UPI000AF0E6B4|nr:hypothetical protein [Streptomyces sp. ERV7]
MRRAALIGVSAAATLALGGALAACGGEGGKPYVAVDAAGAGPESILGGAVPPHGKVELVPLDGAGGAGDGAHQPTPAQARHSPNEPHHCATPQPCLRR